MGLLTHHHHTVYTSFFIEQSQPYHTVRMPLPSASSTSVGGAPRGGSSKGTITPRASAGGTTARQRKPAASGGTRKAAGNSAGMWRFYTEDSPGIKVGPVPVLVMSLIFIASVFVLHIWGKYKRSS